METTSRKILKTVGMDKRKCRGNRKDDRRGPTFRTEPPSRVEFSSSTGAELRCGAEGHPTPKTNWQNREGSSVTDVPGLRYQRRAGSVGSNKDGTTTSSSTLVFPPFAKADYKREVHDAIYQCIAINEVGSILSREVHVKGVVNQRFTLQVYDEFVTRGNTAVLRCHLPTFVRELVTVDAWLRNDNRVLKYNAFDHDGSKAASSYTVLRSGELLIHDVKEKDSGWSYRCQSRHRLTGEMVVSEGSGKIIVTEPHVSTLPRITFSRSQLKADEGSAVQLPCVGQGNPPPTYRWMKDIAGVLRPIHEGNRIWTGRGTLFIRRLAQSDSGQYVCIARNSIGERRIETALSVIAPLTVNIVPQRLQLNVGQEASFSCNVSGHPIHRVYWLRDRVPISESSEPRARLLSRDVLHISSVRREDEGMYQCFANNDKDSAQATAELTIAEAPPSLISVFPERVVQPGDHVSLQCVSTGNPLPTMSWSVYGESLGKQGGRVTTASIATEQGHIISRLNISEARDDDAGEYQCEAGNGVGTTSHLARLNVKGPPFVRRMRNATAISGRELVLQCPYGGYPISRIRWLKGDILLPLDPRQRVNHSSGTLVIQQIEKAADEGKYTCMVSSDSGDTASGSSYVTVAVAPEIQTAYFPETLPMNEGIRTKLVCVVGQGDTPLRFRWLKNDVPFLAHGDTTVQTLEDSSMLTFKAVSSSDRGLYTCSVSNHAASTNRTLQLIVKVPPQWTVEPGNTTGILGHNVWMDCAAVGFPSPTILWKKLIYTDGSAGDFTWVHSSPRAHRFNNGTLALTELEESDEGSYLCQAHNAIGAALTKVVHLKVLIPPRFREGFRSQVVTEGTNITLKCTAEGDSPIEIEWQKDNSAFTKEHLQRYEVLSVSDGRETTSELVIRNTSRQIDTGSFTCTAKSPIGSTEGERQLAVQGKPDPPTNISVIDITSRSLTLTWFVPHDGHSAISSSIVQYKTISGSDWVNGETSQLIVSGSETTAVLRALSPITMYYIRIISQNAIGKSLPSDTVNVTTLEEAPSGPPLDVEVHSTGAQSMKVTWKPPPEESRNGVLRGYHVGYRISALPMEPYFFQKVEVQTSDLDDQYQHSTYITSLEPSTPYDVVVRAFNLAGAGPPSQKVVGKTLETAPPTSPVVRIGSTSTASIDVSWVREPRDSSAITEYTLHYRADGEEKWKKNTTVSQSDKFKLMGLKCGTRYSLYVTASNSLGTGEPSVPVIARTEGAAPRSPKMEDFVQVNTTFASLHLNKWQSMGCKIQRFTIQYRPKQQPPWSGNPVTVEVGTDIYVLGPLSPGREYVVLVTAYSEPGATQGEYHFRSMAATPSQGTPSIPAYGKHETEQPFYRNLVLVVPAVVSSFVLVIVAFAVAICLKKHSRNRRREGEYESQKSYGDSLVMSDLGKHSSRKPVAKPSHYAVPGKNAEYAEPYAYEESIRQESNGLFATIKRCPTRSIYTPTSNKQGIESASETRGSSTSGQTDSGAWRKDSSGSFGNRKSSLR